VHAQEEPSPGIDKSLACDPENRHRTPPDYRPESDRTVRYRETRQIRTLWPSDLGHPSSDARQSLL